MSLQKSSGQIITLKFKHFRYIYIDGKDVKGGVGGAPFLVILMSWMALGTPIYKGPDLQSYLLMLIKIYRRVN